MGCSCGQVGSVLAFYSEDSSSNPAEALNFSVTLWLESTKIKKEASVFVDYVFLKKLGHSRPLFLYFHFFNTVDNKQMFYIKVCQ